MPRAWTEQLRGEHARLAVVREQIERLAADLRTLPEPPDPAPLIEAAVAPVRTHAAEALALAQKAVAAADAALAKAEAIPRRSAPEQLLSIINVIARILAVRLLLFLSVIGAFALTVMAMAQQSWLSLALVGLFAALTIGPLAWLELGGRVRGESP